MNFKLIKIKLYLNICSFSLRQVNGCLSLHFVTHPQNALANTHRLSNMPHLQHAEIQATSNSSIQAVPEADVHLHSEDSTGMPSQENVIH